MPTKTAAPKAKGAKARPQTRGAKAQPKLSPSKIDMKAPPVPGVEAAPPAAAAPPSPSPSPSKHNGPPTDGQLRAHKVEVVASLALKHRQLDNRIDAAMLIVDELKDERKLVRTAVQNTGMPQLLFDEIYGQMKLKVKEADLASMDEWRSIGREAMGLTRTTIEMFRDKVAVPITPDWDLLGYQDCIAGRAADPTSAGVPGPEIQNYMAGYHRGTETNARGLQQLKEEPTRVGGFKGEGAPRPDWSNWGPDHQSWTDGEKDEFLVWYAALDPELEPERVPAPALARIAYLDDMKDPAPGVKDEFEAPPEELAKQLLRPAREDEVPEGAIVN